MRRLARRCESISTITDACLAFCRTTSSRHIIAASESAVLLLHKVKQIFFQSHFVECEKNTYRVAQYMAASEQMPQRCFERFECQRCVWYLFALSDADTIIEQIEKSEPDNKYSEFEIKLDTDQWSSVSQRFDTLLQLTRQVRKIYDGVDEAANALVSVRLFWRQPVCTSMAVNPASHRCKVCVHDYSRDAAVWRPLADPNTLQFACATAGNIVDNARQTQEHLSRLAHYHDGDGTFYPTTAIVKPADAPGQSLLKQAIRVARGEPATGSGNGVALRPPFQTFTTERYPLVSPAVVPNNGVAAWPDRRLRQDNARRFDCAEDEFDIDLRQMGNWYEQHFSGQPSRQDYFIDVARAKGVSKFDIVDALYNH